MKPGEKWVFDCPHCGVRFMLQPEPNAVKADDGTPVYDYAPIPIVCCPFCRGTIQEDE